ncbi:hypothetical protein [Asticcacaulis solisilvae]|uniref:hypothetical protein n=1 Tax=Asticcacaulis solisilvae TaxID=1217274 RepID=UPI003FD8E41D
MGIFRHAVQGVAVMAGFLALAGTACASPMPYGVHPGAVDAQVREGDFDGDGRRDTLYLVDEPATGRIAVHVRLNTASGERDLRVSSYDAHGGATAPRIVPAGRYTADCGTFATSCGQAAIVTASDSLVLNLGDGVTVLMHWQGGRFDQDFIKPDAAAPWAGLADTMAGMYAANR